MESVLSLIPKTLKGAVEFFADQDQALAVAVALRWPNGPICPQCGGTNLGFITTRRIWKCRACKKQFSVKVGTIFEDSPLGLDKWMMAIWMIVGCKNRVSSCEMARTLGITQKSAWFMLHRVRYALHSGTFEKLMGECEADKTFIGGKARNMHVDKRELRITGTGGKDKTVVMGILQRGGKVVTKVVEDRKKHTLQKEVRKHVQAGSALYTDALLSCNGLVGEYAHQVIDHAVAYLNESIHTNGLENVGSLFKRGINGTCISVEPFHLFRYLDEQSYRFNNRKDDDRGRFIGAMQGISDRRLTWDALTGKQTVLETCAE